MQVNQSRFEIPTPMAYQLAATLRGEVAGTRGVVECGRAEAERALRGARRTGTIRMPRFGLRLPVYRASVFGRPYDFVTRRCADGHDRTVGIVPADGPPPGRDAEPEEAISEQEAAELAFELLGAETEAELDQFLGKVFKGVAKVAKGAVKAVGSVGKAVGKAVNTISKVIPIKAVLNLTPIGLGLRAANSIGRIAKGENVFKVAGNFVKAGIKDVGQAAKLASTVASFIPGIGTGVAAALGAAGALADGQPITQALMTAAKSALPGGALAATAFDVAAGLVQGKNLGEAALNAARNQLPGGAAAKAAFDAGLALARGKKIQDAAAAGAGNPIPSPARLAQRFIPGAAALPA